MATKPEPQITYRLFGLKISTWIYLICFLFIFIPILFGTFYTIQSGQEGVLLTFGKASPIPSYPGLHTKIPLAQQIIKYNMQTLKYGVDSSQTTLESAASSDLQVVKIRIALNFHLAPGKSAEIFTKIGRNPEDTVILPALHESTKAVTAQYTAADLIDKREQVRTDIENLLKIKLEQYNIIIEQVSITDFDFSEQFNQAIEAKVTAVQQFEKAKNDLERIKIEKQQAITQAEAISESKKITADGDAYALKVVREQLEASNSLIQYQQIQKWNGQMPTYYSIGGNSPTTLLQLPTG